MDVWKIYLSGEIHTQWREELIEKCQQANLNVEFFGPQSDHDKSDKCGVDILGGEEKAYWEDYKGAQVNSIRNQNLLLKSDLVIVRFGEKYRQWNAAFDAGFAAANSIPYITLHNESLNHALKEVNAAAKGTAQNVDQIVRLLGYLLQGKL